MPRWLAVEEKIPITGWMMENEDEMDFQHTQAATFRKVKRVVALYVRRFRNKVGEPRPT